MYIIQCLLYKCLKDKCAWGIFLSLGVGFIFCFVFSVCDRTDPPEPFSICLRSPICIWSAAFVLQRQYEKNPFTCYAVLAQSLTCVSFLSFRQISRFTCTAPGSKKSAFRRRETKSFWCWFLSPLKWKPCRRRSALRVQKSFSVCSFLSRSRLSSGKEWSACLKEGWALGSCRCWMQLKKGRSWRFETGRWWTLTPMDRWWRWKERDRKCGRERSSRRWLETGKKTLEKDRKWWERGNWRQVKQKMLEPTLLQQLQPSLPSCPSASGGSLCASFSRRCGQTCVHRSRRQRASPLCGCGCVLSSGRCGWSFSCRCGTGRVSGQCGCGCDVSAHQTARSDDRRFPQDKRRAFRVAVSCLVVWGTCACGWALSAGTGRCFLSPGNQSEWQRPWWWTEE